MEVRAFTLQPLFCCGIRVTGLEQVSCSLTSSIRNWCWRDSLLAQGQILSMTGDTDSAQNTPKPAQMSCETSDVGEWKLVLLLPQQKARKEEGQNTSC